MHNKSIYTFALVDLNLMKHNGVQNVVLTDAYCPPPCRMVKEVTSYEVEAKENEAKVQKMRDDGKDAYDIRKQEEVFCVSAVPPDKVVAHSKVLQGQAAVTKGLRAFGPP